MYKKWQKSNNKLGDSSSYDITSYKEYYVMDE